MRRRRRNQCTRRIGRRARRDNWLRGQTGDVQGVQKGRRNGEGGRLIALLPVMAMLGAQIGEAGVHRPRHAFTVRCLLVGHCHRRIGRAAIGRSGSVHLHLHACRRRQPRAGVGGNRQLREQHDADERPADRPQELARHDRNPRSTTKPTADATPAPEARMGSSTKVRWPFMVIGKVAAVAAGTALAYFEFSRSFADYPTSGCTDSVTKGPRAGLEYARPSMAVTTATSGRRRSPQRILCTDARALRASQAQRIGDHRHRTQAHGKGRDHR